MINCIWLSALAILLIAQPAYADFHSGFGGRFRGPVVGRPFPVFRGPIVRRPFPAFRRSPRGPVVVIVPFAVPFGYSFGYIPPPCAGVLGVDAFTCAPLYPYTYAQPSLDAPAQPSPDAPAQTSPDALPEPSPDTP